MSKHILVGIDIGTSTCKAVFLDANTNSIVATELEEINPAPQKTHPEWVEYDATEWWSSLKSIVAKCIKKCGIKPTDIAGISISGFTCMAFLVDEKGNPLNYPTHYNDMRHLAEVEILKCNIGDKLIEMNGNVMGIYNGLAKQLWFKHNRPDLMKEAKYFTTEVGWLNYKLTNEWSWNRPEAGFYGQYDYRSRQWSKEILDKVGIPVEMFPRLYDSWEKVGEVTELASQETGFAKGTPVFAGADDASPIALTTGAIRAGQCYISIGSSSNIITNLSKPAFHPTCIFYPHCIPSLYMFINMLSSTGTCYKWLRNTIARTEVNMAALLNDDPYKLMDRQVELSRPGSGGLIFLPYMDGEWTPINDPEARGVFLGLSSHTSRADIFRSVMEGTAMSILHNIILVEEQGIKLEEIVATGGPTKSKAWMQIIADVTGVPISLPHESEGAPYGNAVLAGIGAGVYKDYESAVKQIVRVDKNVYNPRHNYTEMYREIFEIYLNLYPALKKSFNDLAVIRQQLKLNEIQA